MVSFSGIDDVFSQRIHARFSYAAQEVVWGKAFRDMLRREDGKVLVELEKIHDTVELSPS